MTVALDVPLPVDERRAAPQNTKRGAAGGQYTVHSYGERPMTSDLAQDRADPALWARRAKRSGGRNARPHRAQAEVHRLAGVALLALWGRRDPGAVTGLLASTFVQWLAAGLDSGGRHSALRQGSG